ncbi:MAG: hypothetical protein HY975_03765, partial [Candidatus Kerfeldbacteria bacterium]|nr:hypothetical protein [Candidatus Kerfeldbacteria bacterium]
MRKGTVLPIAVMAFAIVGFLFVVSYAITAGQKWPWSTPVDTSPTTNTAVNDAVVNTNT